MSVILLVSCGRTSDGQTSAEDHAPIQYTVASSAEPTLDEHTPLSSLPGDPHSANLLNEKRRLKSPALEAYETAMEQIDYKIGLANVVLICGLKGSSWYDAIVGNLQNYRRQPALEEMRRRLTLEEWQQSIRYDQVVGDAAKALFIDQNDPQKSCEEVAKLPFANDDSALLP